MESSQWENKTYLSCRKISSYPVLTVYCIGSMMIFKVSLIPDLCTVDEDESDDLERLMPSSDRKCI